MKLIIEHEESVSKDFLLTQLLITQSLDCVSFSLFVPELWSCIFQRVRTKSSSCQLQPGTTTAKQVIILIPLGSVDNIISHIERISSQIYLRLVLDFSHNFYWLGSLLQFCSFCDCVPVLPACITSRYRIWTSDKRHFTFLVRMYGIYCCTACLYCIFFVQTCLRQISTSVYKKWVCLSSYYIITWFENTMRLKNQIKHQYSIIWKGI